VAVTPGSLSGDARCRPRSEFRHEVATFRATDTSRGPCGDGLSRPHGKAGSAGGPGTGGRTSKDSAGPRSKHSYPRRGRSNGGNPPGRQRPLKIGSRPPAASGGGRPPRQRRRKPLVRFHRGPANARERARNQAGEAAQQPVLGSECRMVRLDQLADHARTRRKQTSKRQRGRRVSHTGHRPTSVNSTMKLPKSAGVIGTATPPRFPRLDVGVRKSVVERPVKFVDDFCGCILRCSNSSPTGRIVARHEFG
jgi:hypothetical protein